MRMVLADLVILGPWGWAPLAIAMAVAVLVMIWVYRATSLGPFRWVCAGCKAVGVGILVFCLLEPVWSGQRVRPGANLLAVVADNSEGLSVRDRGGDRSRGEVLRAALDSEQAQWMRRLEEDFDLRRYQFDSRLRTIRDFTGLDFKGRSTSLYGALAEVLNRLEGLPLAGVIVLTDGNATDLPERLRDRAGSVPIYPVVIGQPGAVRDLALVGARVTQTAFEDAPVRIQVDVQAVGLRGRDFVGRVVGRGGDVLKSVRASAKRDLEVLPLEFEFKGQASGTGFYQVEVNLVEGLLPADEAGNDEATLANNRRAFVIDHGRGSHRILYVSGRPNWEFKYLNRALQEDEQLELVGLMRLALREPKFDFRGRAGESSNPLYRGFGDQAREDVEQYDQPVLLRLQTQDEDELSSGFPLTAEELFRYEAIILDDLEAGFFSVDQADLVRRFVSERGGGLLMLGGAESFRNGGYDRTPIGDTLPVYLDQHGQPPSSGKWQWNLTREGWLQAWARLRSHESAERTRLEGMKAFGVLNHVGGTKPGASTIATVLDSRGAERPALVTQRFGRGRTAALMVGDLWRWGMQGPEAREDLSQTWRQLARWLVADVPGRAELAAIPSDESGMAVELQTRIRSEAFEPIDDAVVALEVATSDWFAGGEESESGSVPIRMRAELSEAEAGRYDVTFVPRDRGVYRVTATVTNAMGAMIHRLESGWASDAAGDEFRSLEPDFAAMATLAQQTGGQVVGLDALADFARGLPSRSAPMMEAWSAPAWHTPWLFGLALVLFAAEWGIRRWKGMP